MMGVVCLASCGSDDDDDNSTLIVGVWECTSANYGSMGSAVRNNLMEGDILTINSDMTYSIMGNRNSSGRCSVSKDEITISGYKYKIHNLSSTTLSLSISLMGRTFSWSFRRK